MFRGFLVVAMLVAADVRAEKPCVAEYQNALQSITHGNYSPRDATDAMTAALRAQKLDAVDAAIESPAMQAVSVETRAALHGAVTELRRCFQKTPPAGAF